MLLKTQGIILHTLRYNDQNLIVKIFTRHTGMQSYLVRSSRKSKNTALFQPLNILLLESRWQENKNLQRIKECTVDYQYNLLPYHPERRAMAMMMNEFMIKCLQEGEANEELFAFMMQSLIMLDQMEKTDPDFHIKFTIQLAQWLGFGIQNNFTSNQPVFSIREGCFVSKELATDPNFCFSEQASLHLSTLLNKEKSLFNHAERNELLKNIIRYYQMHVPGKNIFSTLKSHEVLMEVYDSNNK
jgi:DNA repair protein RecO (recombination protein O)